MMIRPRFLVVAAMLWFSVAFHTFGAEILNVGPAERCGTFNGVRPTIDVDSKGQPHVVVDTGHTALGRTMRMFSRINGSWRVIASGPTTEVNNPSSMSQPWVEIDANDRLWLFAQFFTAGNLGQSGHGIWCYENITSSPTRSPTFGRAINGGTGFIKYAVGHGWGPGNISIDPYLMKTQNAGVYIGSINGAYQRIQYSPAATIVESGVYGPRASGEKYRFRIAPREGQKGIYHGVMNGSLVLSSAYWNSEINDTIVWADVNSYYHQGDDHNHAGVCGDLKNPSIGYMAAVFESSHDGRATIQPGLNFNVWTGRDMVYNKPSNRRLGLLDGNAEFIHRYAPAMTPAHGGGCWVAWGDTSHQIWLGYIDQKGKVGSKKVVAHGFTCAINTDESGNVHMAYNASGIVHYRKIRVSGGRSIGPMTAPADFDGDGAHDMGIYNPATGRWWGKQLTAARDGDILVAGRNWGGWATAIPVPGNYFGDAPGADEVAVFDQATARWYHRSVDKDTVGQQWGAPGDIPVPRDYNGDNRTDLATYDSDTGKWFISDVFGKHLLVTKNTWGYSGAIPVPADYDGDGSCDLAVYDPNTYKWYIRTVGGDIIAMKIEWGFPGTIPVALNYDADPEFEMAAYDPATGKWYIRDVDGENKWFGVNWGFPGAMPAPANYDGDPLNIWELGVYHPGAGNWYVRGVNGIKPANWGWSSTRLVPLGAK